MCEHVIQTSIIVERFMEIHWSLLHSHRSSHIISYQPPVPLKRQTLRSGKDSLRFSVCITLGFLFPSFPSSQPMDAMPYFTIRTKRVRCVRERLYVRNFRMVKMAFASSVLVLCGFQNNMVCHVLKLHLMD